MGEFAFPDMVKRLNNAGKSNFYCGRTTETDLSDLRYPDLNPRSSSSSCVRVRGVVCPLVD